MELYDFRIDVLVVSKPCGVLGYCPYGPLFLSARGTSVCSVWGQLVDPHARCDFCDALAETTVFDIALVDVSDLMRRSRSRTSSSNSSTASAASSSSSPYSYRSRAVGTLDLLQQPINECLRLVLNLLARDGVHLPRSPTSSYADIAPFPIPFHGLFECQAILRVFPRDSLHRFLAVRFQPEIMRAIFRSASR